MILQIEKMGFVRRSFWDVKVTRQEEKILKSNLGMSQLVHGFEKTQPFFVIIQEKKKDDLWINSSSTPHNGQKGICRMFLQKITELIDKML